MNEQEDYFDDLIENEGYTICPVCALSFDDADFDFQICSRCGWSDDSD